MKSAIYSFVATFFLIASHHSSAALILDQSADAFAMGSSGGGTILRSQSILQTFTVGLDGLLAQVDLQVQKSTRTTTDNMILSILGTENGVPDTNRVLGSVGIAPDEIPPLDFFDADFISVDVSQLNIMASQGDHLTIKLSYPIGLGRYFAFDTDDFYSQGEMFTQIAPDGFPVTRHSDMGFQTWMASSTSAVPEPSSFLLMSFGILGIIAIHCRHKRSL